MKAASSTSHICAGDYVMVVDSSLRNLKGARGWVSRLVPRVRYGIQVELPDMPCSIGFASEQLQRVNSPRRDDPQAPDQQTLF